MTASTIPAFVTAFLTAAQAVVDNTVLAPPTTNVEKTALHLFCDPNGAAPLPFDQEWAGSGSGARSETYDMPCLLYVRSGDSDQAALLALLNEAMSLFEAIAALFRPSANFGITGKTLRCLITSGDLIPIPTTRGLLVRIAFNVNVQARI